VLKPDGSFVESHGESDRSASEPWYRLYYDTMSKTLSFPALAPGDVLEVAYRVDDVASENLLSDYFGDLTFVDGLARQAAFDYVLIVPAARPIHASAPAGVAHAERTLPTGEVEHRFSARGVPRLDPEPHTPGWSELARFVHVSTYASWDEVARFYWGLVKDQVKPGPEVRAEAERIARAVLEERAALSPRPARAQAPAGALPAAPGAPVVVPPGGWDADTRRALVRAVYGFVVSQTRYVGLEFGIHGYKPYRVEQILGRRFGDCKDKASLMHALLEALGIDSRLVLLRMRRLGRLPDAPASLAVFNHAILYVPDLDLWLDGTAAYSGSGELPGEDRGATVLVVNPGAPPRFGAIPEAPPDQNRAETHLTVALAPDGGAALQGELLVAGEEAPTYRRSYQAEDERRALLEASFAEVYPGIRAEAVTVSDPTRIEEPVSLRVRLTAPRFAQPDQGGLRFTPFGGARGYVDAYAPLSARRLDLDLGSPTRRVFRYEVRLPEGWRVASLPEAAREDGPFGRYELRYREEGGVLVAEGEVALRRGRIAAKDYPAFRALLAGIDRALARKVRIVPGAAAAEVSR
jgi:transglutaminase-like putative cysteine protease